MYKYSYMYACGLCIADNGYQVCTCTVVQVHCHVLLVLCHSFSEAEYLGAIPDSGSSIHPAQLAAGVHQIRATLQGVCVCVGVGVGVGMHVCS